MRANATFEVTGWDQVEWDESPSGTLARARVTKQFSGEVDGTSVAEVLAASTSAGPAAYTAQERFTGALGGRSGSFIAQHGATSLAEGSQWIIVTGSGSDELAGLSGTATLTVHDDGTHAIEFEYQFEGS
jgi:hypothetical protein